MSWSSYIDNLETKNCKYAAIVGRTDDTSPLGVWGESADKSEMNPAAADLIKFGTDALNEGTVQNLLGSGVVLGGIKFACIRYEMGILICQGKGDYKDYSLVFASTGRVCLIGFNPLPDVKAAKVRESVEVLRDYLKGAGY